MHYITVHHNHYTISNHGLMILGLLALWELAWKGFALWRAGQKKDKIWFGVLLIVNTAGLLEILYLFVFSKYPSTSTSKKR